MLQTVAQQYQRVRVTTSNQGELLIALYDGLFRFLNSARICFEHKQPWRARELNSKAFAIISELQLALDPKVAPDLCANLSAIYDFCLERLRGANRDSSTQAIDDVIRVLTPLRDAWNIAVPKAMKEGIRFEPHR